MKKTALILGPALLSSLCCITPVLALIAGTSGLASTFSWLDPLRPYFIGLTAVVLGFAWYQKLQPKKHIDCNCDTDNLSAGKTGKPRFIQSKAFLGLVTVFAGLMLAFPLYAHIFYPKTERQVIVVDKSSIRTVEFTISGMTCKGCEEHIKHAVSKIPGFIEVTASYEKGTASMKFDKSKSTVEDVIKAIHETGYTVTDHKIIE